MQDATSLFGGKYLSNVPLKYCKVFKGVVPKISGAYCLIKILLNVLNQAHGMFRYEQKSNFEFAITKADTHSCKEL